MRAGDARTLQTAGLLVHALQMQGEHAEAEAIFQSSLEGLQHVLVPDHPRTVWAGYNLALSLSRQSQHAEAAVLLRGVLAAEQRTTGPGHAETLQTASLLAKEQATARTAVAGGQ